MEINEIKKAFYKEKLVAHLSSANKTGLLYWTMHEGKTIWFRVPYNDIGDATFFPEMEAKHMIRYIVQE